MHQVVKRNRANKQSNQEFSSRVTRSLTVLTPNLTAVDRPYAGDISAAARIAFHNAGMCAQWTTRPSLHFADVANSRIEHLGRDSRCLGCNSTNSLISSMLRHNSPGRACRSRSAARPEQLSCVGQTLVLAVLASLAGSGPHGTAESAREPFTGTIDPPSCKALRSRYTLTLRAKVARQCHTSTFTDRYGSRTTPSRLLRLFLPKHHRTPRFGSSLSVVRGVCKTQDCGA